MKQKSFTLIELLVVVAVFSIIITVLLGIFVSTIRIQRYSLVYQQMIDQSSYAMEYMSRLIRMAKKDNSGSCITAGKNYESDGTYLKFLNYRSECQTFSLNSGRIYQNLKAVDLPLTSEKLTVTSFKFFISGDESNNQPKVTILLEIEGKNVSPKPKLKIQTTISQRNLNY